MIKMTAEEAVQSDSEPEVEDDIQTKVEIIQGNLRAKENMTEFLMMGSYVIFATLATWIACKIL